MIFWQAIHPTHTLDSRNGAKYHDINRNDCLTFDVYVDQPGLESPHLLLRIDLRPDDLPPKRLIWRRRVQTKMTGESLEFYLAGWQRTIEGRNVQAICYVFNEGTVVLGGEFDDADPFMYGGLAILDCEKV